MSVSRNGDVQFKDIGDLGADDVEVVDTGSGNQQNPDTTGSVEVDFPIQTADNEVFVVIDAAFSTTSLPHQTAGLSTASDDYASVRRIISVDNQNITDEELDEKALVSSRWVAYNTTIGHHEHEDYGIKPYPHSPRVMPFGTGTYQFHNSAESTASVAHMRAWLTGYVLEVDDDQMTRYLRQFRA